MSAPTTLDRLLTELERGAVEPERYSRLSLFGRCEPIMLTTVLAALAIWSGMLLGGITQHADERIQR